MIELLAGIRRRLRIAWAAATLQTVALPVVAVAAAVAVLGRLRPWGWTDIAALAILGGALAGVGVGALLLRIGEAQAARAADRGLHTKDVFATALEVRERPTPFAEDLEARATSIAAARSARDAVPLPAEPRRIAVALLGVVVVLGLVVAPNPQDEVRRQRAAEHELLAREAERVREAAEALEQETADAGEAARALEEVARALEEAGSLEDARREIDHGAGDLARDVDPNLLAAKAAVRGLERTLEQEPLGAGATTPDQLRAAADALGAMSAEELATLAERLEALADTQAEGAPDTAAALREAAEALRAGEVGAAATALQTAAGSHERSTGSLASSEAAARALGTLAETRARLDAGAPGGDPNGDGSGAGNGDGDGDGDGAGDGSGDGAGDPGGDGTGGATGQVPGSTSPTGNGTGGPGSPAGNGNGPRAPDASGDTTVYDPVVGGEGEDLHVDGRRGEGPDEIVGREHGPTTRGETLVPLTRVLPHYRAQATVALDRLDIPPSVRAVVRAYFDRIGDG